MAGTAPQSQVPQAFHRHAVNRSARLQDHRKRARLLAALAGRLAEEIERDLADVRTDLDLAQHGGWSAVGERPHGATPCVSRGPQTEHSRR